MTYAIHRPEPTPIVYIAWNDDTCCHIGDGKAYLRVTTWLLQTMGLSSEDLQRSHGDVLSPGYRTAWLYVNNQVKETFTVRHTDKPEQSAAGNVERLLQALYCWQSGRMPEYDYTRGRGQEDGNGNSTGSFIANWDVVAKACDLYELLEVTDTGIEWPSLCGDLHALPPQRGQKFLTFTVDLDPNGNALKFRLGYTYYQQACGVPQHNHAAYEPVIEWIRDDNGNNWKCCRLPNVSGLSESDIADVLSDLHFDNM